MKHGKPVEVFKQLAEEFPIEKIFTNHDYEPYAVQRDSEIELFLKTQNISFHPFKDHVIFERDEVLKDDGTLTQGNGH